MNFRRLIFFYFSISVVKATIISVPEDYPQIQLAINASNAHDTVLVSQGVYIENIDFSGKSIVLTSQYLFSIDTLDIQTTTIDGNQSGSVVSIHSREDSTTQVIGFTIRNGNQDQGAGIYINGANPRISQCRIMENATNFGEGAGIYIRGSNLVINHVNIIGNVVSHNGDGDFARGGGICIDSSTALISNSQITTNEVGEGTGGGIYISNSQVFIEYSTISENRPNNYTYTQGSAIWANNSYLNISHSEITGNSAGDASCGGIYASNMDSIILSHAIVSRNSGSDFAISGGGVGMHLRSSPILIENSTFYQNRAGWSNAVGGAGGYLYDVTGIIVNSNFSQNVSTQHGAGLYIDHSDLSIKYSSFTHHNVPAWGRGGGSYAAYSHVVWERCLFAYNSVGWDSQSGQTGKGSALYTSNSISSYVINCTFSENTEDLVHISPSTTSGVNVINSILWNNTGYPLQGSGGEETQYSYSDLDWLVGNNQNINQDPLFFDSGTSDFSLQSTSPCIDSGTNFYVIGADTIVDYSSASYLNAAPDMGYLEFGWPLEIQNYAEKCEEESAFKAFPNPLNNSLSLEISVPEHQSFDLFFFDARGREVFHKYDINLGYPSAKLTLKMEDNEGTQLSSGIYICAIRLQNQLYSKKITLIK